MEGCFMFQWGGGDCFSDGGALFLSGGAPYGHQFWWEGGLKKIVRWGRGAPSCPSTMGNPEV